MQPNNKFLVTSLLRVFGWFLRFHPYMHLFSWRITFFVTLYTRYTHAHHVPHMHWTRGKLSMGWNGEAQMPCCPPPIPPMGQRGEQSELLRVESSPVTVILSSFIFLLSCQPSSISLDSFSTLQSSSVLWVHRDSTMNDTCQKGIQSMRSVTLRVRQSCFTLCVYSASLVPWCDSFVASTVADTNTVNQMSN